MTTPTVGRILHFFGNGCNRMPPGMKDSPLAAIIAWVNVNGTVNVSVLDVAGHPHGVQSVTIVSEGDEPPTGEPYCRWPQRT